MGKEQKLKSKMFLINSALVQGIDRINNTPYRSKITDTNILYEKNGALGEDKIADLIRNIDMDELTHPDKLLVSTASQFVWGEEQPDGVREVEEEVISKARSGFKLTKEENILLKAMNADTDYF
jgi:hypothetical protein